MAELADGLYPVSFRWLPLGSGGSGSVVAAPTTNASEKTVPG